MADKLFPRLLRLLTALGIHCRYGFDPLDADFLGDAGPLVAHSLIIYADDALDGADDRGRRRPVVVRGRPRRSRPGHQSLRRDLARSDR